MVCDIHDPLRLINNAAIKQRLDIMFIKMKLFWLKCVGYSNKKVGVRDKFGAAKRDNIKTKAEKSHNEVFLKICFHIGALPPCID